MNKEIKVNEETYFVVSQNPSEYTPIYLTIYTGESITKVKLTEESIQELIHTLMPLRHLKL